MEPLCNKLKRLGATCLFVASKVRESRRSPVRDAAPALSRKARFLNPGLCGTLPSLSLSARRSLSERMQVAEINSYSAVDFAHAAGVPLFNRCGATCLPGLHPLVQPTVVSCTHFTSSAPNPHARAAPSP